jgi:hypothetical protein
VAGQNLHCSCAAAPSQPPRNPPPCHPSRRGPAADCRASPRPGESAGRWLATRAVLGLPKVLPVAKQVKADDSEDQADRGQDRNSPPAQPADRDQTSASGRTSCGPGSRALSGWGRFLKSLGDLVYRAAALSLILRYVRGDDRVRRQMLWLLLAVGCVFVAWSAWWLHQLPRFRASPSSRSASSRGRPRNGE